MLIYLFFRLVLATVPRKQSIPIISECVAFVTRLVALSGRIVNVASASGPNFLSRLPASDMKTLLGKPWTIAPDKPHAERVAILDEMAKTMDSSNGYGSSKALLSAYTHLLAKEKHPDIIVNACTPGYIDTDLTAGMGATNPPSKGAVPPCYLAMDEVLIPKTTPGRYCGSDCVRSPLRVYHGPGDLPYEDEEDASAF